MSFTLQNVSPSTLQKLLTGLKQDGNQIDYPAINSVGPPATNQYTIRGRGIVAKVVQYVDAQALVVTILDKPFFIGESFIEQKVREALASARLA
jgi:hypothetical protein